MYSHKWAALLGLSLLSFTAFLDFTIIVTALPFIQKELQAPVLELQWVSNGFAISLCVFMILGGKLGDMWGQRLVLYGGAILCAIAALGSALAPSIQALIFFRILQGIATSFIVPNGTALVGQSFREHEQTRALSIFSTFNSTGLALGPFLGGLIISLLSWRLIFWINIPILAMGGILCLFTIGRGTQHPEKIDWIGVILLFLAVGGTVYGTIALEQYGWNTLICLFSLLLGFCAFICLLGWERKVKTPLIDLSIFANKHIQLVILVCISAAFPAYVFIFFDPLYLHIIRGFDAFWIGLILVTVPIVNVLVSLFFERLEKILNVFDLLLFTIISSLFAALIHLFFIQSLPLGFVLLALILMGYTWGICNIGSLAAITRSVKANQVSASVGSMYTCWNVSGSIMLAISSVLFHQQETKTMQQSLQQMNMNLSPSELEVVKKALINPENADTIISTLPQTDVANVFSVFAHSFIYGYQWVSGFAVVSVAIILGLAFRLRRG